MVSEKQKDYNPFLESYGYDYITGAKGLVVYKRVEHIDMQLREDTFETQKQLRKATYKGIVFHYFGYALVWWGTHSIVSYGERFLFFYVGRSFSSRFYCFMWFHDHPVIPMFIWSVNKTSKTTFRKMNLRFYLIIIAIVYLVI